MSCTLATPALPAPALMPSARPFSRSGKKKLMLVVEEAKLPPPMPLTAAQSRNAHSGAPGSPMRTSASTAGTTMASADRAVQVRPPSLVTAQP